VGLIDWVTGRAAQCEVRRATLMRCWTPACRRRHQWFVCCQAGSWNSLLCIICDLAVRAL
jgi:hypothetical protein